MELCTTYFILSITRITSASSKPEEAGPGLRTQALRSFNMAAGPISERNQGKNHRYYENCELFFVSRYRVCRWSHKSSAFIEISNTARLHSMS